MRSSLRLAGVLALAALVAGAGPARGEGAGAEDEAGGADDAAAVSGGARGADGGADRGNGDRGGEGGTAGGVRYHLDLHGRYSSLGRRLQPSIPFDAGKRAFDASAYLAPEGSDAWPSVLLSAGAEGRRGRLRWGLLADTGELRSQSFPRLAGVCLAPLSSSPSGLDVVGSGHCTVRLDGARSVFPAEETRLAGAQLTANGRPFGDELRGSLLLREAWLGATFGENDFALVRAGRRRFTVGDGFVHDDWGTGAEASFDLGALGPSWDLGVALFEPRRDLPQADGSVVLALRADFLPSLFEHAGVFAAWFRDRSDGVVELFRAGLAEPGAVALRDLSPGQGGYAAENRLLLVQLDRTLRGSSDLGWFGASGSLARAGLRLDFTAALAFGQFSYPEVRLAGSPLRVEQALRSYALFGQLAHARLRVPLGPWQLGGFVLFESGDAPPQERARAGGPRRYGGFLGISPYVTDTNLFFQGGVSESFASRQATAPGVNGRGVLAPGLTASWDPLAALGVDARAAWLLAPARGPFGGTGYGTELDLEASWSLLPWLTLLAEADVLFPGDFFAGRAPVTKVVVGADLVAFP